MIHCSNIEDLKNSLVSRLRLEPDYFIEKRNILNLIYRYSTNPEKVELRHIEGFTHLFPTELTSWYGKNDIEAVLSLLNFGKEFNDKIINAKQIILQRKEKIEQEAKLKAEEERLHQEQINAKEKDKYTNLFKELFNNDNLSYQELNIFLEQNEGAIRRHFNCRFSIKNICCYFDVSKELKAKIYHEEKLHKEKIKAEQIKEYQKKVKEHKKRLAYLAKLGLASEVMITQTTLKAIFTDKIIAQYFPEPFSEAQNPNLSKGYQNYYGLAMKLYRMADVMEVIKKGIKPRFKNDLKDEYKKLLSAFMLDLVLKDKPEVKKDIVKI